MRLLSFPKNLRAAALVLLIPFSAISQPELQFERLTIEDGLAGNEVECVMQDRKGFLWFGTKGGLNRFDGQRMKTYLPDPDNPESISFLRVRRIIEDQQGKLWITGYGSGISCYDPEKDVFHTYSLPETQHTQIQTLYEDRRGNLWAGTWDFGILRFDRKEKRFEPFPVPLPQGVDKEIVIAIAEDSFGYLWFGVSNGLYRFSWSDSSFRFYPLPGGVKEAKDLFVRSIFEDSRKNLWVGTNSSGLFLFQRDQNNFTQYLYSPVRDLSLSGNRITWLNEDINGWVWIGTINGLILFDPVSQRFHPYESTPNKPEAPEEGPIWSICRDRQGDMWLGTVVSGVFHWSRNRKKFRSIQIPSSTIDDAPQNNATRFMYERPDGQIWMSIGLKVVLYNPDLDRFSRDVYSLRAWTLFEDPKGWVWAGTFTQGLGKFHPAQKRIFFYRPDSTRAGSLPGIQAPNIFQDRQKIVWVHVQGKGWHRYDPVGNSFEAFLLHHSKTGAPLLMTGAMYEDRQGNLWMSTRDSLTKIHPDRKNYTHYFQNAIRGMHTNTIHQDSAGALWLGTYQGLVRFDPNEQTYRHWSRKDGLPHDMVQGLLEDARGNLWISTMKGLSRFDPRSGQFKNYDASDGLPSDQFHENACLKTRTGELFFGGINGFVRFHPDSIGENPHIPPVLITDIRINNQIASVAGTQGDTLDHPSPLSRQIPYAEEITLAHWQKDLFFEFAALNYFHPEKNQYKYRLENYDEDWIAADAERPYATYTNLSPGRYVFRVIGSNNDGVWNEKGASLRILIRPPWWLTWWAKILYGLAFLGGLYLIRREELKIQYRKLEREQEKLAQERKVNEQLQRVDQLKDQFLANTSHELRTPLHGIIGIAESVYEAVERKTPHELRDNLAMIAASGRRLASLVNDLLDFSRARNRDLQLQLHSVDLHILTEVVLHSCRPMTASPALELRNEIPPDFPPVLADENRLQQILYNLVGNAIKFTREGFVKVGVKEAGRSPEKEINRSANQPITVFVEDTGIGIPPDNHEAIFRSFEQASGGTAREYGGTGLGLSITRQLVELHGGRIWVESAPGQGSTFFFTLPPSDRSMALKLPTISPSAPEEVPSHLLSQPTASLAATFTGEDRLRILIVDDEPVNHQVLRNYLEGGPFALHSAMNGEEALAILSASEGQEETFDLVLLDVMMPRLSGYAVCQRLREKYLPSELPVIMVTAKNQVQDLVQGLSLGANDYLAKPFSKEEFLARVKTQLELHHINEMTSKFVPAEFLRALGRERITELTLNDHTEREVTVMFTDIRDYTTLAETMTPEENYRFVKAFNGRIGPIIQRHGGFINQYLGDAVMAIFLDSPQDALSAATDIQRQLAVYNAERTARGRPALRLGTGLAAGPLVMGIIGDRRRMDAATISDTVNTASRIESLTKHYSASILLSEETWRRIQNGVHSPAVRYLGRIQVKGRRQAVGIYECFGGDPPEAAAQKQATLPLFDEGREHYFNRSFAKAVACFQQIVDAHPADATARYFLGKAAHYISAGAPDDWTGVEVMTFK